MKDDNMENIIGEELEKVVVNIKMSQSLRERIQRETTKRRPGILEQLNSQLNRTIEIPVIPAIVFSLALAAILYLPFNTTLNTKSGKSLISCTEYKIIQLGNISVVVNKDFKGDAVNENN